MRFLIPILILLPIIAVYAAPAEDRTTSQPIEFPFVESTSTRIPQRNMSENCVVFIHAQYDIKYLYFFVFTTGLLLGYVMMGCWENMNAVNKEQTTLRMKLVYT